jgi:hypothetical protein
MSTKDCERLSETSEAFIYVAEPPDGEAVGLLLRLFGQFLNDDPGDLR